MLTRRTRSTASVTRFLQVVVPAEAPRQVKVRNTVEGFCKSIRGMAYTAGTSMMTVSEALATKSWPPMPPRLLRSRM